MNDMQGIEPINKVFLSEEAARYLGISVQRLNYLRRQKKIHATQVGNMKLFTYTIEDLKQANLRKEKTGKKPKR